MTQALLPILLLFISNVFMTIAWYGHLKFTTTPVHYLILIAWGIALIEYCFAVPANRIGYGFYHIAELKAIQEIISLIVFALFSVYYLNQSISTNHVLGFCLIAAGAYFVFK